MTSAFRKHLSLLTGIALLGFGAALNAVEVEPQPGIVVEDLPYGQVLYEFYKEDYFLSLTTLLVEEDMGRIPDHAAEAELLRGGLYLSYGLHTQAGEIFERLLATNPKPEVRDRAWFFLGKARFQRGYFEEAGRAFAKAGSNLKVEMEAERDSLQAQVDIAGGDLSKAEKIIDQWEGPVEWSLYAAYNLGVALIRNGRMDEAAIYLNKVGTAEARTEELYALRDRANLAMGFGWLQREDGNQARLALERVRLNGPFSNAALLGFGWAEAADGDYRSALVPWLELIKRNHLDPAVQEGMLAVAYAYRQLDANQQAMDGYKLAINTFEQEIRRLDKAINAADSGQLVELMLTEDVDDFSRWNWELEDLPDSEDSRYLLELIATHKFQGGLRNYRDLQMLHEHLNDWRNKLGIFTDMIDTRRAAYDAAMAELPDDLEEQRVLTQQEQYQAIRDEFERAKRERDIVAFATAEQQDAWDRIRRLELTSAGADQASKDKLALLKGVLFWDMEREYKYRAWQQSRSVDELEQLVTESTQNYQRFETDIAGIPEKLDQFGERVVVLEPKVDVLLQQIEQVADRQVSELGSLAAAELSEQKQRLIQYRAQARFAQAAIFDRSPAAGDLSGDAP